VGLSVLGVTEGVGEAVTVVVAVGVVDTVMVAEGVGVFVLEREAEKAAPTAAAGVAVAEGGAQVSLRTV